MIRFAGLAPGGIRLPFALAREVNHKRILCRTLISANRAALRPFKFPGPRLLR